MSPNYELSLYCEFDMEPCKQVRLTAKEKRSLRDKARWERLKSRTFTPEEIKARQEKRREYFEKRNL